MQHSIPVESWQDWPASADASKYADAGKMQGLGENLLAEIFDGKTTGGEDYDIDIGPERWEVKESTGRSVAIRAGASGRSAWQECFYQIVGALTQIEMFVRMHRQCANRAWGSSQFHADVARLEALDRELRDYVIRGEISRPRVKRLGDLFSLAAELRHQLSTAARVDLEPGCLSVTLTLSGVEHTLTDEAASRVLGTVSLAALEAGDASVDPRPGLASILSSPLFASADAFAALLESKLSPEAVFGHVDGMFVVNRGGYFAIPAEKMRDYLGFTRLSQCTPRYEFLGEFRKMPRSKRQRRKP